MWTLNSFIYGRKSFMVYFEQDLIKMDLIASKSLTL